MIERLHFHRGYSLRLRKSKPLISYGIIRRARRWSICFSRSLFCQIGVLLGIQLFFCCLTGGRFLGAVTEDTLNALMENALVFLRYRLLIYYFFASSNRATIFLATTSIETLCSLAVRNIISMCSWSITFLPQEHMALTLICFVMIFMEVNKRIFYLRTGLFGLSSQPETVAKIPSFVVKRRIIPL